MKKVISQLIFLALAVFLVGCEEDDSLSNNEVSQVESLYSPQDNIFYNLGAQSSAVFEWQAAKAEDNGVVLYDVVFDVEGGDFSDPVYVLPSDGRGMQRTLNLPFSTLNQIAGMAGIESQSTGRLQWTVWSSKGINVQESGIYRTIEVERPGGFPTPDELFLVGSATEAGDDLGNAIPMKKTGANTYEVYTSLSEGEYQFVTRTSGTPETYYIEDDKLKINGTAAYTGEEKVYRIRVDFSDGNAEMIEIQNLQLWFAPNEEFMFDLPYVGNGTWMAEDQEVEFRQEDWGRDERYKFMFTVVNGGETQEEWYGSTNGDNQRPNADSPASYWHMVPVTNDRWNNSFKFADEVDMSTVDVEVIFNAEVPEYTHRVTVVE
ncbi:SusE domain-containing protein [Salinimicrobium sp. GXAS 041]|uniref:SusE domain-containing protein n=1 Tax=Salinimicrobium sp. GXAS 041 TaxID=3400806 RepID=UPI003C747AC8